MHRGRLFTPWITSVALSACGGSDPPPAAPPPESEPATLIATRPEPPGAHCPSGGTAIDTGGDVNGSGVLDPDEVEDTSYLCAPAPDEPPTEIDGDLTIHSAAEAAPYARLRKLSGRLFVFGTGPIAFPALEEVGWLNCTSLTGGALELPALARVTNALTMTRDCPPTALPRLAKASAVFILTTDDPVELPALETVDTLEVDGPREIRAPRLTAVTTRLTSSHAQVLDVPVLTVGHRIDVAYDGRLDAPALRDATLRYQGSSTITEIELPALETGSIALDGMNLASLSLPRFTTGSFSLTNSQGTDASVTLSLPSYTGGGSFTVSNVAMASLEVPHLAHADDIEISSSAQPTLLDLGQLEDCSQLRITQLGRGGVNLSSLRQVQGILVIDDTEVHSLALPALTSADFVAITGNAALTAISAPLLTTARLVRITDNPALPSCMATAIAAQAGADSEIHDNGDGSCP